MSLDSMLARHSDFQLNRESEALKMELEAKAHPDPAQLLFQSKKLPGIRGAYKAPQIGRPSGGDGAAPPDDDEDDFDAVMASVVPTPSKLEVADTASTAPSLRTRALAKDPLRIGPCFLDDVTYVYDDVTYPSA
eukprot:Tamp_18242.p2 GENE.Tamp_18242~~Tamp_18242.p2  ORF type:complete len:134 (-),score=22.12 Tamp_18242:52-453(-)